MIIRTDLAPYASNKPTEGTNATTIHSCCSLCTQYQSRQCPRLCETRVPTRDQNLYSKQCRAKLHVGLCIRVYAAAPRAHLYDIGLLIALSPAVHFNSPGPRSYANNLSAYAYRVAESRLVTAYDKFVFYFQSPNFIKGHCGVTSSRKVLSDQK